MIETSALRNPDRSQPFSLQALSAVLLQEVQVNFGPIAYASKVSSLLKIALILTLVFLQDRGVFKEVGMMHFTTKKAPKR